MEQEPEYLSSDLCGLFNQKDREAESPNPPPAEIDSEGAQITGQNNVLSKPQINRLYLQAAEIGDFPI